LVLPCRVNNLTSSLSRKFNNLLLVVFNSLVIRVLFPTAAVGVALWCSVNSLGVLNVINISTYLSIFIAFVVLDLSIYLQHVLFHYLPILWKIHRVHHADQEYDVTTGLRFHPIEIVLSMLIKFVVIVFIGAPVLAVVIFEIVLNATAMFNHGNIKLPKYVDNILRYLLVTPDMHRVHHSVIPQELNSNFGFNISVWDRVFGTYIKQPKYPHKTMKIGLNEFKDVSETQSLLGMLKIPFDRNN
jgi:sterol desaturase/sphingolipid hydroxylase (fatty acid hydroxylase superfamily)